MNKIRKGLSKFPETLVDTLDGVSSQSQLCISSIEQAQFPSAFINVIDILMLHRANL